MFGQEIITRRCLLTLEGGYRIQATLSMPRPKNAMFPEVMEREFIKRFNESQPYAENKVVKCHIMRN